ncbi:sensor histidine kinase [Saccharopolyspora mangrovi]|uniref:histidine kinase n=1 Tax=Saccharopolyspora mangrovi TaxID=3082379 RepID=A0ABU6A357_9PSEU|nr:histidine kinase [Saccharopolyspora sp. S2-29]MEB3365804.1 histidine kinase [Saccharopolyspora sp. S2-29]
MPVERKRSWLSWWDGSLRSLLFDLAVAGAPVAGEFYAHGGRLSDTSPLAIAALTTGFLALVVRRRFPFAVALVMAVASLPANTVIGPVEVALYTVASRCGSRPATWVAVGVHLLALVPTVARWGELHLGPTTTIVVGHVVVPVLIGLWVFGRRGVLIDYQEKAEQVERERKLLAERAVEAQRREIAREMHDVVAHRIGVVSRHADVLAANATDERSAELAEIIRSTSATAMSELREMLRALRDDTEPEPASASTTGIVDLVSGAAEAGANVRLDMPEPAPEVPPEVGRAAYRVVQEALTNAAKHAPHAAVQVTVRSDDDELAVTVTNRRSPRGHDVALPTSGFGLVGMRERVALTGGKLQTGRTGEGGYRVHATFPLDEEPASPE